MRKRLQNHFTQNKFLVFTSYLILTNAAPRKLSNPQTESITAISSQYHPQLITRAQQFAFLTMLLFHT